MEFPPIEAPPEPILGPDDHHSRDPEPPPVFGATERPPMREPPAKPAVRLGKKGEEALKKIIWGATVQKVFPDCEEHHLFPRQEGLRIRFERAGIEVDDWAVLIPADQHREAHRRTDEFGPGGKWNWDWQQWWIARGAKQPDPDDVFVRALEMIYEYKLEPYGLPIQYGYGRSISSDLYDIVQPPRTIR
ncbi:MAG TPA: DUF2380 domain-containing protein [Myxococcaceae bacterium]|nr:DUF2380 domain-containing protein [Myxococcaceae bacterium]